MRSSQPKARFASILAILCFFAVPRTTISQTNWFGDSTRNTMVCDTVGQQDYPAVISDGADGAIIVWEDARASGSFLIYGQRLDRYGFPMWPRQGIALARGNANQRFPIITTDNNGGAYVAWLDSRNPSYGNCIYAQHVLANGALAYPDSGLPVGLGPNGRQNPAITDDGKGNAFVVWEENRSLNAGSQPDIFINRLWPNSVKYTDSSSTLSHTGSVRKLPWPSTSIRFFDGNAHFKSKGQGILTSLQINIVGKGRFPIASVIDDTTLDLNTYPSLADNLSYYIIGLQGIPVDTSGSKQLQPSICSDGFGGCYVVWQSGASAPISIRGMHFDSTCTTRWTTPMGYQIYKAPVTTQNASHVNIKRDTANGQLMLVWEVTNTNSADTQDVYGARMNCATPADTSFTFGGAVQITGDALLNQMNPQVFSDDSDWTAFGGKKTRGLMVGYRTGSLGSGPSDWDIGMTRLRGDGSSILPAPGSWYKIASQPLGQIGLRAVKVDTGLLLAVWNDARNGGNPDTCIYAQVIDKWGYRHLPTWKTNSTYGIPICHGNWSARQVALAPRTGGAIAVWTDFRKGSGDPSIYAQLILSNGSLELPHAHAIFNVQQQVGSFDGSECNAHLTSLLAIDTSAAPVGFRSITQVSATNMTLATPAHASMDTVPFSVQVIDSMQNGRIVVRLLDTLGIPVLDTITYCTIPDTRAPAVTWLPFAQTDTMISITAIDSLSWDRGLDSIRTSATNLSFDVKPTRALVHGLKSFSFTVHQIDTSMAAQLIMSTVDIAGNKTRDTLTLAAKAVEHQGVNDLSAQSANLRVYPNPSTDVFRIDVGSASGLAQTAEVRDLLGREVARFSVQGSTTFDASTLPAGTYIIRVGSMTCSIVKE
ncbi:MAG: T9SS type A sorting domain-containing protein [Bacteroidota bacterium]|nr:T9SS type A sorting domain-containing protein [Bacteroidota bacterium]MDP4232982.1 T9SS type A sorting domain-containing protein [Bacteroidota bacterium]MDP4242026.1 T9SS type A sorting domain-containing protein [Bacteroidota bacterium]MDP4286929.1 T9SS type A sorting domain-containing protein [Bacteroidota bacterium]